MRKWLWLALIGAGLTGGGVAHAGGVGAKVGTLGVGGEVLFEPPLIPWFDVRVGVNRYNYGTSRRDNTIDYDMDLRLSNAFAAASVHVPVLPFRFTAGVYANSNRAELVGRPENGTYRVGDRTYPAEEVGHVQGRAGFDSTAPYTGIGMDFSFLNAGLSLDAGVLWQGSPVVDLSADGPITAHPQFDEELERERQRLEDDLSSYDVYPVVSATLFWRF